MERIQSKIFHPWVGLRCYYIPIHSILVFSPFAILVPRPMILVEIEIVTPGPIQ